MKKFIIIITLVLYTKNISDILTKLSLHFYDGVEGVILYDILNVVLLQIISAELSFPSNATADAFFCNPNLDAGLKDC
ncbi:hypothetical protein T4B_11616 [Trichinella pseudospiralis]|uniref:Uncharacterized protein n=1 Tax=Trichinella pseudospiralis TaxID=6337 RepID=A0A0V1EQS5_TRIPS|nr:hypothetical protein T4A_12470 [Trichinella pseudospiralis]KRZ23793.1 hypothetical protein T4B_11616 [Trichinella pseudospiralis]KRZ40524.1 hypothetical protein T4C_2148 [Trichinella pseudospiralis]